MSFLLLGTVHKNGSSNAIVIPKSYCRVLKIERGDQMTFEIDKHDNIVMHKISKEDAAHLRGEIPTIR